MPHIPHIQVSGSHYEVGYKVGQAFKQKICESVQLLSSLKTVLLPFYNSEEGRQIVDNFLKTCQDNCPFYLKEIQGTAEGAGIPFIELFLLHLELEIITYLGLDPFSQEGCTDLYLVKGDNNYLVHSEDAAPIMADKCYLVDFDIAENDGKHKEKFTAFCYPGFLAGTAFIVNSHGMCGSMNIMFQKSVNLRGIPRRVACRSLAAASSVEDAISRATKAPGISTGFNYNYMWITPEGSHISGLELAGTEKGTLHHRIDATGFHYHFNNFKYVDVLGNSDPSSEGRSVRFDQLLSDIKPDCMADLFKIMGDKKNTSYPIYRNGHLPDYLATAAIGVFEAKSRRLMVYADEPANNEPLYVFPIPQLN